MILPAEPSSDPDTDLACPSSPVRCTVRLYHRLRSSLYLSSWKEAFYSPFYTILASASISRRGMCLVVVFFVYKTSPGPLVPIGCAKRSAPNRPSNCLETYRCPPSLHAFRLWRLSSLLKLSACPFELAGYVWASLRTQLWE